MSNFVPPQASPFARCAQRYIDNGLPVLPIAPGTKRPGEFAGGKWRGMSDWTRYSLRLPTELELNLWQHWPDAGIGLMLGPLSGLLAVDIDTEDKAILEKINKILPPSPVRKKGKKGWTSFYRFAGEENISWRVKDQPIMDLLCEGRQTLMPGTQHPDGMTYLWLTEDTLDDFNLNLLPELPKNFVDLMNRIMDPLMTEADRQFQKARAVPTDNPGIISAGSFAASHFREINEQALFRLDEWVPRMIPTAKTNAQGYRCKAFWRNAEALNVSITRMGIKDFGGDYGMTAIDLVMYAQNVPFAQAAESLRTVLNIAAQHDDSLLNIVFDKKPVEPKPVSLRDSLEVYGAPGKKERDPILVAREKYLAEQAAKAQQDEADKAVPDFVLQPPGMIGRIAGWMADTAPKSQPELFVAAALSLGAAAMGRLYRSTNSNWTSLYVVMVAKTGEGKEHPQQCVAKILAAAGQERLLAGAGYTSPGAVISTLLRTPSHIAIIDEIGKLLKASRSQGNAQSEAAIDKLVEAYSKPEGYMKPANYSQLGMNASQASQMAERIVYNPCINILGATTPDTFYQSLTSDLISEGFLGRIIIVHSKKARQKTRLVDQTPPPADVVAWVRSLHTEAERLGDLVTIMDSARPASPITMPFAKESLAILDAFDDDLLNLKDQHEGSRLDSLLARTREKAMRVAMVVAKATNPPGDNLIRSDAVEWAIKYVRHYDLLAIRAVTEERSESVIVGHIKRAIHMIKRASKNIRNKQFEAVLKLGGMPHSKLARDMGLDKRTFDQVVETAVDHGYISKVVGCAEAGYAGIVYWLRNSLDEEELQE